MKDHYGCIWCPVREQAGGSHAGVRPLTTLSQEHLREQSGQQTPSRVEVSLSGNYSSAQEPKNLANWRKLM